jgi:undecaprenyl-diphosphatase
MIETLEHIDQHLLLWLNSQHSVFFDGFMYLVSDKYIWIPFYLVILVFMIRKYRCKSIWIILAVVVLITLSDQISNLLKYGIKRPRPCKDPEISYLVHIVNQYCSGAYGFVSAHAANSFALATFVAYLSRKKWITTGMFIWASVVSYSRIYLGVHYPGDVICGAIIGAMLAWIIHFLLKRFNLTGNP